MDGRKALPFGQHEKSNTERCVSVQTVTNSTVFSRSEASINNIENLNCNWLPFFSERGRDSISIAYFSVTSNTTFQYVLTAAAAVKQHFV